MIFNIIVGVLGILAIAAGVFAWKLENGSFGEENEMDEKLKLVEDQEEGEEKESFST